jgi:hypothetical protein
MPLDWCTEILGHHDIGPVVIEALKDMEDVIAMNGTCQATKAYTDKEVKDAQLLVNVQGVRKVEAAARRGKLRMVRWFLRRMECHPLVIRKPTLERACSEAACYGHVHVIEYLRDIGTTLTLFTAASAATGGQLECLKWLHVNGERFGNGNSAFEVTLGASRACDTACLEFVLEMGCKGNYLAMGAAAELPHAASMELLYAKGTEVNDHAMNMAAKRGRLENLKWLHARSPNGLIPQKAVVSAALHGHRDCLEYANLNSARLSQKDLQDALKGSCYSETPYNLDCLTYIVSIGGVIDDQVMGQAVRLGNTKFVDTFVAYGHKPKEVHMRLALFRTEVGELEDRNWKVESRILACLRKHNTKWPDDTISSLINPALSRPWDHRLMTLLRKAVTYGAKVQYGHKHDCCVRNLHDALLFMGKMGMTLDDKDGKLMHTAVIHNSLYSVEVLRAMGVRCNCSHQLDIENRVKEQDLVELFGTPYLNTSHEYMKLGFPESWKWRFPF